MAEKGVVINTKDNFVTVKMMRQEACAKCRACIAGMEGKEMFIEAENLCDAKTNDWVEIEMSPDGFIKAVLIMYGIPFLAFMLGIGAGYFLGGMQTFIGREIVSFIVGLIFTFIAFMWIKSQEARWSSKKYRPVATRITTAVADAEFK